MGLFNALQGFCVIGIIILIGYIAARFHVGGPTAQMVLNRFSFFVSTPCLMFALLSKEQLSDVFKPSMLVALLCATITGIVFLLLSRTVFHLDTADATVGALVSMYMNANNIGLPVATYILGDPAAVTPIILMQQVIFTPIALTALDLSTKGRVSAKAILSQPLHQPILIGVLIGIAVSATSDAAGWFIVPKYLYDPINIVGQSAVPLILMAFGMSLKGSRPLQGGNRAATIASTLCKDLLMPALAFILAYFMMGFRGTDLYACVVLAALPCAQNVYNYAARYDAGTEFARDGVLLTTITSPIVIFAIAALLG
ncbi:transporter, auxin efflux carrier (AEC) family protein [Bifidobacterium margollesii]|uniref:Transporter, auxin efflux carrier (AEC) family protein n=1 Tax=Bifidobacterium margollesii TaxID=2020964 RepID=A0A2N5JBI4_9BIFI|nr:AEC family transporter [Bifidobacterium margollesii]PLS31569.1 transporter, auxin efflux carrier (AEC) family protein [Bifidobacterium margollesii]